MDITTTATSSFLNIEYNTINISTFIDFINLGLDELVNKDKDKMNISDLVISIKFVEVIYDKYMPKISILLKENIELSESLFYNFMDCWSMTNHIFISINKLLSIKNMILKEDIAYINDSLQFVQYLFNDFDRILSFKILDLCNKSHDFEENYKKYQDKLESKTKLFDEKFYKGFKEPNKNMKELLATEFVENEFN